MNLSDCYLEEDLFPKIFTDYEEGSFRVMETRKAGRAVFEANGNKTRC